MDTSKMDRPIMVNFPLTAEDFASGNGEGVWVKVDAETKAVYDADASGGQYVGVLDNDSFYYPGLNHGALIPFEMRGEYRPVADFYGFLTKLA